MPIAMLIEYLTDVMNEVGEDAEVRLAMQPRWPFEYSIQEQVFVVDGVVYLAERNQLDYLSQEVAEAIGW